MTAPLFHMIAAAPTPVAPFSHAVEAEGWVFVTGQMPTEAEDDAAPLPEGVEAQTRKVMENLKLVLRGVGLGLEHVVAARACPRAPASASRAWPATPWSRSTSSLGARDGRPTDGGQFGFRCSSSTALPG